MFYLLLAPLLIAQDSAPKTITYTNFGARTEVVLADLSKQTGITLLPSTNLRDVPLTLRLKEAPLQETLDKIALVEGGKWVKEDQGIKLVFDQNIFDVEESKRQDRLTADRVLGVQQWLDANKGPQTGSIDGYMAQILSSIGSAAIGGIGSKFITAIGYPTRPLIAAAPEIPKDVLAGLTTPLEIISDTRKVPTGPPDKIRLYFHVEQNFVSLFYGVKDANGLYSSQRTFEMIPYHDEAKKPSGEKDPNDEVKESPLLQELMEVRQNDQEDLPKDLKEHLMDPVTYDPSAFIGEYMVQVADSRNLQLICTLDSGELEGMGYSEMAYQKDRHSKQTYEDLLRQDGANFSKGWVTLGRKVDPETGTATAPIQHQLLKYLQKPKLQTAPTMNQLLAAYQDGFANLYLQPNAQALLSELTIDISENLDFLKLMSRLSPVDISTLQNGRSLRISNLPPAAQEQIAILTYGPAGNQLTLEEEAVKEDMQRTGKQNPLVYALYADPFEVCNTQLPANATISLEHTFKPIIRSDKKLNDQYGNPSHIISVESYAQVFPGSPVQLGSQDDWTFKAHLTPFSFLPVSGSFYRFSNIKKVTPNQFPPDIRAAYETEVKSANEP